MKRDTIGILVLDEHGEARFASGLGKDVLVARKLADAWRNRGRVPLRRMWAISDLEQPLTIASAHSTDGACFMIFPAGESDELSEFLACVDSAADILRHFVSDAYRAMVVVDAAGKITYMSPIHERAYGLRHGEAIGRHVSEVIENTGLPEVVRTGKAQVAQMMDVNGVTRIVSRIPIYDRNHRLVAAIGHIMFKGPEVIREMSNELTRVRKELDFYRRELSGIRNRKYGLDQIVGSSDAVKRLKEDIIRVAPLDVPVLLVGESGTGKELVAHAIHMLSPRSDKPMVVVNSAAMPANLVESELFGYEAGAFTGADKKGRKGKFEAADTSSLFLDEIGDMPLDIQVKLLRVLQDGLFERIGGDKSRQSDFRLISASNRDFAAMISDNTFRLDLFYRISAVTLRLPPLRDRLEDIPELANAFLEAFLSRQGLPKKTIPESVIGFLQSRSWPGNIRQLQHAVERAAIFSDGSTLTIESFGNMESAENVYERAKGAQTMMRETVATDVRDAKDKLEAGLIMEAMQRTRGNKKRVAEELGISRSYLYKRLKEISEKRSDVPAEH